MNQYQPTTAVATFNWIAIAELVRRISRSTYLRDIKLQHILNAILQGDDRAWTGCTGTLHD